MRSRQVWVRTKGVGVLEEGAEADGPVAAGKAELAQARRQRLDIVGIEKNKKLAGRMAVDEDVVLCRPRRSPDRKRSRRG